MGIRILCYRFSVRSLVESIYFIEIECSLYFFLVRVRVKAASGISSAQNG